MSKDYIPGKDADLLAFSANFSTLITASPTSYGVTAGIATTLSGYQSAFADALAASTNPTTRGGATVLAKNLAKTDLVRYLREVAMQIQMTMSVTDEQKFDLGLTIKAAPTDQPPPATRPGMDLISVVGRTVRIHLHDIDSSSKRAKPLNVRGAFLYSHVGATYPTDPGAWKFDGPTNKNTAEIVFDDSVPNGAQVWICAVWFNQKSETGPVSVPITTNLQGGLSSAVA